MSIIKICDDLYVDTYNVAFFEIVEKTMEPNKLSLRIYFSEVGYEVVTIDLDVVHPSIIEMLSTYIKATVIKAGREELHIPVSEMHHIHFGDTSVDIAIVSHGQWYSMRPYMEHLDDVWKQVCDAYLKYYELSKVIITETESPTYEDDPIQPSQ